MAPEELVKALPKGLDPEQVVDHLKIHAGPTGSLGETFLIRYAARWLALYRASMFEGFTLLELDADDPCDLEREAFQAVLELNGADGSELRLDISSLDMDRVEHFLGIEAEVEAVREAEERLSQAPAVSAISPNPPEPRPSIEGLDLQLMRLLGQGEKVEAVTLCRRTLGSEMAEARAYVEELEEQLEETRQHLDAPPEKETRSPAMLLDEEGVDPEELDEDQLHERLCALVSEDREVAAIKLYREATGAGLEEAREYIEELVEVLRAEQVDDEAAFPAVDERPAAASSGPGLWPLFWILIAVAAAIAYFRFGSGN